MIDYERRENKSYKNIQLKPQKAKNKKRVEVKIKSKKQGLKKQNSKKYDRYYSTISKTTVNIIWSKYTNKNQKFSCELKNIIKLPAIYKKSILNTKSHMD